MAWLYLFYGGKDIIAGGEPYNTRTFGIHVNFLDATRRSYSTRAFEFIERLPVTMIVFFGAMEINIKPMVFVK